MYEQSINDYMNVLMGTSGQAAQTKANSPSTLDNILSGLQLGGSAAGGLATAMGGGGGGMDAILSTIGSLAI